MAKKCWSNEEKVIWHREVTHTIVEAFQTMVVFGGAKKALSVRCYGTEVQRYGAANAGQPTALRNET
jgi:hypothetical protein